MEPPTDEEIEEQYQKALRENTQMQRNATPEEIPKAQMILQKRLIIEMKGLQGSLDSYRFWSGVFSVSLIILSLALLLVSAFRYFGY